MQHCSRIFFVLFSLVFLTAYAPKSESAGLAFTVTPMITDLTVAPGATQTGLINIDDNAPVGSTPVNVKVSVKDWTLDQNGNAQYSEPGTTPGSCANWLTVTPLEFTLKGGGPTIARYSITVPPDAQGCYRCILFFTTAPLPTTVQGTRFDLCAKIGNTIYVQVGPAVHRAKITDLQLTAKNVSLTVQNTGSSYIRLGGDIKIADASGTILQQVKIPGDAVLPGSDNTRIVPIELPSALATGSYTITALLDYGGDALLGARVNATLP
jgi:P pilus assembly chaperone PapD